MAQGGHTGSATITDLAGNTFTTNATFTATGTTNPNAPVMTQFNLIDAITQMPDVPEIWVQGTLTNGTGAVSASVNGGEPIPMNQRDLPASGGQVFGRLLPIEWGTNVIVVVADGGGGNLGSKMFVVVRSDRFQASWESPAFGSFVNGQTTSVAVAVSPLLDEGLETESVLTNVEFVTSQGLVVQSSGDLGQYSADVPGEPNGKPLGVAARLTWQCGTNQFVWHVPLGLLEGYEIIRKRAHRSYNGLPAWYWSGCDPLNYMGIRETWDYTFDRPAITNAGSTHLVYKELGGCGTPCDEAGTSWSLSENAVTNFWASQYQPGLPVIWEAPWFWWLWPIPDDRGWAWGTMVGLTGFGGYPYPTHAVGRANDETWFRTPIHYKPGQVVVFTLEYLDYGRTNALDLSQVKYKGYSPIGYSNEIGSVSYLMEVGTDLLMSNRFAREDFEWPLMDGPTQIPLINPWDGSTNCTRSITEDWLSFWGFHNNKREWRIKRNNQSQADAECDDRVYLTIDELAQKIHLEASQFTNWLAAADGKTLPTHSWETINESRQFKIPNEAHMTLGDATDPTSRTDFRSIFMGKRDMISGVYSNWNQYKYKVVNHFIQKDEGQSLTEVKDILSGSTNIYVWAHFGHGVMEFPGDLMFWENDQKINVPPTAFSPHHKLSKVVLYACTAGVKSNEWGGLVAKGGSLWATHAVISPAPDHWSAFWIQLFLKTHGYAGNLYYPLVEHVNP